MVLWPLLALPATAQTTSQMRAGDLQQLCSVPAAGEKGACQFYIWGVAEAAASGAQLASDNAHFVQGNPIICIPDAAPSTDLETLVKLKLREDLAAYPADRDMPAISFVMAALFHQYPCRKAN